MVSTQPFRARLDRSVTTIFPPRRIKQNAKILNSKSGESLFTSLILLENFSEETRVYVKPIKSLISVLDSELILPISSFHHHYHHHQQPTTMPSSASKKGTKKSANASTASQGKPPQAASSLLPDYPDSGEDFVEDEFDDYQPPRARGSRGKRTSSKNPLKVQDFVARTPETRSKKKTIKIKTEPVSPTKNPGTSASSSQGGSGQGAGISGLTSSSQPLPVDHSYQNPAVGTSGGSAGTKPGGQKTTKPFSVPPAELEVHRSIDRMAEAKIKEMEKKLEAEAQETSGWMETTIDNINLDTTMSAAGDQGLETSHLQSPSPHLGHPPATSTPVRGSGPGTPSARTPSKNSPRRSPRGRKDITSSPGKELIKNHISQFAGLARKKASRETIREESESAADSEIDATAETVIVSNEEQHNHFGTITAKPLDHQPKPTLGLDGRSQRELGCLTSHPHTKEFFAHPDQTSELGAGSSGFLPINPENLHETTTSQNRTFSQERTLSQDKTLEVSSGMDSGLGGGLTPNQSRMGAGLEYESPTQKPRQHKVTFQITHPSSDFLGGEGQVEVKLASAQPPSPPPPPPPAAPIPSAVRCVAGGPTGLESPASSNVTEVLSPTVKGPSEKTAEQEDEEAMAFFEADKRMTTPPSSEREEAMDQDDLDLQADTEGAGAEANKNQVAIFNPGQDAGPSGTGSTAVAPTPNGNPAVVTQETQGQDVVMAGDTAEDGLHSNGPPAPQTAAVRVTEVVAAQKLQEAVVRDPVTGETQVISCTEQRIFQNNVSSGFQDHPDSRASLASSHSQITTYPAQYLATQAQIVPPPPPPSAPQHTQTQHFQPAQAFTQNPEHSQYQPNPDQSYFPPQHDQHQHQYHPQHPAHTYQPHPDTHPQQTYQQHPDSQSHHFHPGQFSHTPNPHPQQFQTPQSLDPSGQGRPNHLQSLLAAPPPPPPPAVNNQLYPDAFPPLTSSTNHHPQGTQSAFPPQIQHQNQPQPQPQPIPPPPSRNLQKKKYTLADSPLFKQGPGRKAEATPAPATTAGEDSSRPAVAGLPPSQPATVTPEVEMVEENTPAAETNKNQHQETTRTEDSIQAAARILVQVPAGEKPPPERDPKDPKYDFRGLEQRDLDVNAMKLWKQGERIKDFELIFGTRDPAANPTEATEEFYRETGYRRELSVNHIMAALRNAWIPEVAEELLKKARVEGPERDRARLCLLQIAIDKLMVPAMQKKKGLRNAKGKKKTPEEATAILKMREVQSQMAKDKKEGGTKKAGKSQPQPGPSTSSSSSATKSDAPTSSKPSAKSTRPLARQPSSTRDHSASRGRGDRRTRGQHQGDQHQGGAGSSRGRGRDRSRSELGGRHHTPASDQLGRSQQPSRQGQNRQGKGKSDNNSNNREHAQNKAASEVAISSANASGQGSSHGQTSRASATATATVSTASAGASASGFGSQRRTRTRESEASTDQSQIFSQESIQHDESVSDPNNAARAGDHGPQPPAATEADSLRLVVSGKSIDPDHININQGEANERLIPWIGREVESTHRGTEASQVGLRDIHFDFGRIIIHPSSQDGGEWIAEAIRTRMQSDNHPKGFDCEWNGNLDPVAELTVKTRAMGKESEEEVRKLIEAEDGGLCNLNIALCGWPAHLAGGTRYLRFWDEHGYRIIKFIATKGVVEAIMSDPHRGKVYIGHLMGTVRHERADVVPGAEIAYRRQYSN